MVFSPADQTNKSIAITSSLPKGLATLLLLIVAQPRLTRAFKKGGETVPRENFGLFGVHKTFV